MAQLAAVTLIAAVVQGAVGFGFSLLAIGFFLQIIGSSAAVPVLIVVNLTISLALVAKVWGDVDKALWKRLVLGAIPGLPLGLLVFRTADLAQLKVLAAMAILGFVMFTVLRQSAGGARADSRPSSRHTSQLGVGALAGTMATSLGLPGPPVVLYLTAIGAGKRVTRATTLTFFTVSYAASLILQTAAVGVAAETWITAGVLVPVAVAGAFVGHRLAGRVSEVVFRRVVLGLIAGTGVYVLADTLIR